MARRGRPSKGAEALKHQVCFRLNDADHLTYLKLGGAAWFREQLQACRVRIDATPTAHQPFPLGVREHPAFDQAVIGKSPVAQARLHKLKGSRL